MQELPPPVPPPQQSESCHVIVAQGKESRPSPAYQRVQKPVVAKHRNLRSLLITLLRTTRSGLKQALCRSAHCRSVATIQGSVELPKNNCLLAAFSPRLPSIKSAICRALGKKVFGQLGPLAASGWLPIANRDRVDERASNGFS
jgi:hypothetical protein